jgi:two-component system chemotaxis response regulator CheY
MKILIVEDDAVSSMLLKTILAPYGECSTVEDGESAVRAFDKALTDQSPFLLICLDIMLPGLDGQNALKQMRAIEERHGVGGLDGARVVMITALGDHRSIMEAFRSQCEGYIVKPIRKDKVIGQLKDLGLIRDSEAELPRSKLRGVHP